MFRTLQAVATCCALGCGTNAVPSGQTARESGVEVPANPPPVASDTSEESGSISDAEVAQARTELAKLPALSMARTLLQTTLVSNGPNAGAAEVPPADAPLALVKYAAGPGELSAYVTKDPRDGKRRPAIIWITDGDTNSIGDVWSAVDPGNDQTAAAYRKVGLVMMFPSQRGGNDNPGRREGFLGEVDDILAARAHLAGLPYVDRARIYLGGHSTGGSLALLVAASSAAFRATFSFGPVGHISAYGGSFVYCDPNDDAELMIRSPGIWLKDIRTPTFVFEGSEGNVDDLRSMQRFNENPLVRFFEVKGTNHFAILAPVNALIAPKLIADEGAKTQVSIDAEELARAFH